MKTKILLSLFIVGALSSCTCNLCDERHPPETVVQQEVIKENNIRGTVTEPWHETMHDTIQVPGQIDQTNTYYRAPHKTVVEIRPGKYSETTYDNERK